MEFDPQQLHKIQQECSINGPNQVLQRSTSVDPNKFQICIDVHQFAPSEIVVKTVGRQIVVEGKHEEKQDAHGYISRHFVRKYTVPEGHEPNEVFSTLSSDGVLTVTAPRDPIILPDKNERIVPILQTGPVHREVKELNVEHLQEHKKKNSITVPETNKPEEHAVPLAIKYL